ncbi:hypothetical protein ACWDKQ_13060 [Saccharopolyspora sp. NPDC000995]
MGDSEAASGNGRRAELRLRRDGANPHGPLDDRQVALVGDAGYCASVLSGQGTSLALVGAYVLAEE